jgi:hypothetical protein
MANWEDLVCAIVRSRVQELVRALQLHVFMIYMHTVQSSMQTLGLVMKAMAIYFVETVLQYYL